MENVGGLGQQNFNLRVPGADQAAVKTIVRLNQVLMGEVLQKLDGQSIILGVGQHRIPANTSVELQLGQTFAFRVEAEGEDIVFKVLQEQSAPKKLTAFDFFQKNAGKELTMANIFRKLAEVLQAVQGGGKLPPQIQALAQSILQSPPEIPGTTLPATPTPQNPVPTSAESFVQARNLVQSPKIQKNLVSLGQLLEKGVASSEPQADTLKFHAEQSGKPLENRLHQFAQGESKEAPTKSAQQSLKAMVMNLEGDFEQILQKARSAGNFEDEKAMRELLGNLRDARNGLEAQQIQNALRRDVGEAMHFQIPVQEGGQFKTADFFFEQKEHLDTQTGESTTVHHLLFLLDMSRLGPVRVDAMVKEKNVDLNIQVESPDAVVFLNQALPKLRNTLNALGFSVGHASCMEGRCREESNDPKLNLPVLSEKPLLDLEG